MSRMNAFFFTSNVNLFSNQHFLLLSYRYFI